MGAECDRSRQRLSRTPLSKALPPALRRIKPGEPCLRSATAASKDALTCSERLEESHPVGMGLASSVRAHEHTLLVKQVEAPPLHQLHMMVTAGPIKNLQAGGARHR